MKCPYLWFADKWESWETVRGPMALYLVAVLLDWASSIAVWITKSGAHESNQFARNAAYNFVLRKGFVIDVLQFVMFAVIAYYGARAIAHWNVKLSVVATAGWFLYFAADRLVSAVLPNILYAMHFYVADPQQQTTIIMGYRAFRP